MQRSFIAIILRDVARTSWGGLTARDENLLQQTADLGIFKPVFLVKSSKQPAAGVLFLKNVHFILLLGNFYGIVRLFLPFEIFY